MDLQKKQDYHCTLCDFKSAWKYKLEKHISMHTREKPFLCVHCKREFRCKEYLKEHVQRVHLGVQKVHKNMYKCSLCPYEAYIKSTMETHRRTHTGERCFPCQHPGCQYAANKSQTLRLHNFRKHTNERKFVCQLPNCEYRGKTMADMKVHSVTHSNHRPFVCDFQGCSYRAKRKCGLRDHKIGVHGGVYKPFACAVCNHCTTSKALLRRHQFTHAEEKTVKCYFSGCAYSCKSKKTLNGHVQNNHTERKFKCDFPGCSATAAIRSQMEEHKKRVHYEKAHQCPNCDYRVATAPLLGLHIARRHNPSQRISCPNNGCSFKTRSRESLKQHMQRHTANLQCPVEGCSYIGPSDSSLKRHMHLHDPTGRPFHCPLCPKHFVSSSNLQNHLRTHTQEKPFRCPFCNHGSKGTTEILRHVRAMHSTVLTGFVRDYNSICDHCCVNFSSAIGLAMHTIKFKTAVVVLKRLHLK